MFTRVLVTLMAVITFVFMGADIITSFESWECTCIHNHCEWCNDLDEVEWSDFHADAIEEYTIEFTELFDSYDVKFSKNNRTMLRKSGEKGFKFVAKA